MYHFDLRHPRDFTSPKSPRGTLYRVHFACTAYVPLLRFLLPLMFFALHSQIGKKCFDCTRTDIIIESKSTAPSGPSKSARSTSNTFASTKTASSPPSISAPKASKRQRTTSALPSISASSSTPTPANPLHVFVAEHWLCWGFVVCR